MTQQNQKVIVLPGDSLDNVRRLVTESANSLVEGANMLYRLHQNDSSVIERLTSGPDGFPDSFVNGLLKVGEKSLHPMILLNRCPAYRKLAMLSYKEQEDAIEKGVVDLVIDADSGDVIKVPLTKLDGAQLKQVITLAGIRSKDEQRAWLKQKFRTPSIPRNISPPYVVKRDRIQVLRGDFELSRLDLLRILEQLVA